MDEKEFNNNMALQKKLMELVAKAVRDINTEPAFTPEQKKELIKDLGGAPKHLLFEFLNVTYRSGPDIAKSIKDLISADRPRHGPKSTDRTTEEVLNEVESINKPKKKKN